MLDGCCCGTTGLISSPSALSATVSCLGARATVTVILRSRAASSDLSCFNSSSLPHVLAMIASSLGTSALSLALQDCRASLICCQALLYAVDNILVVHEELFEDVVDYIADVTGWALFRQKHKAYCLNELRLYTDFRETVVELACVMSTQIDFQKTGLVGMVDIGVVGHKNGFKW